jgi:hypothetical protein
MIPNGAAYVEEIPLTSSADALQISPEETDLLDEVFTEWTEPKQKHGSEFMSIGTKIKTIDEHLYKYPFLCTDFAENMEKSQRTTMMTGNTGQGDDCSDTYSVSYLENIYSLPSSLKA